MSAETKTPPQASERELLAMAMAELDDLPADDRVAIGVMAARIARKSGICLSYKDAAPYYWRALDIQHEQHEQHKRPTLARVGARGQKKQKPPPDLPEWDERFPFKMHAGQLASGELQRFILAHGGFWLRSAKDLFRIAQKRKFRASRNTISLALGRWRKKHKKGEEPVL